MEILDFKSAFSYPFNRAKGMLNILWVFLPIIGWLALLGYTVRIIKEFLDGKFTKLPEMKFGKDLEFGFLMFVKSLPFAIAYSVAMAIVGFISPGLQSIVDFLLSLFVIPILGINFFKKETVGSYFEFGVVKAVFTNLGDYIVAILKSIGLAIIFIIMCVILVGFPALSFTQNIFLADFYRRNVK